MFFFIKIEKEQLENNPNFNKNKLFYEKVNIPGVEENRKKADMVRRKNSIFFVTSQEGNGNSSKGFEYKNGEVKVTIFK